MPKTDYIDREAFERRCMFDPDIHDMQDVIYALRDYPAADVRPVVRGEWVWDENGMDWGIGAWICSRCHNRPETTWHTMRDIIPLRWSGSHYCPNCGAWMTGGRHAEV